MTDPVPPAAPLSPDVLARLDAGLRDRCRAARVPALSGAVGRAGDVVWSGTAGWAPADAGTAFRIGSITKPMTAVAVLRLVAAGRVGLQDPVGRHVDDAPAPQATVAQLLTHTAGLPAEPPGPWWERHGAGTWPELVASGVVPVTEPGEQHHYSNVGYAVLGRLVERAHGRPWDDVLRDELWAPLRMSRTGRVPASAPATGYAVHPHADMVLAEPVAAYGAMGPAGEVWSTPRDLVAFGSWLVGAGGADADDLVLPLRWRRRMTAPRVVVDELGAPFTTAWGLGVSVRHATGPGGGRRTVGHGGSVPGFTATLRADVATGDVVAVCGSSTAGFGDGDFLLDALPTPVGPATPADPSPETLALTGTWYWGPMAHTLVVRGDGHLLLSPVDGGGRGTVFAPAPHDGPAGPGAAGNRATVWVGVEGGYWRGERLRSVGTPDAPALDVGTFHLTRTPYDPATAVPGGVDRSGWVPSGTSSARW